MPAEIGHVSVLDEPEVELGRHQSIDDPRQGLFLFGPLDQENAPKRIRVGVIGTAAGLALYRRWAAAINRPILANKPVAWSPFFPGFSEVFGCEWPDKPNAEILLHPESIANALRITDRHQAIYNTVSLFIDPIRSAKRSGDEINDLWFVVVPDVVHLLGRPLSRVAPQERIDTSTDMDLRLAKRLHTEPSLFDEDMVAARPYYFDLDFHHQLKVRLVSTGAVSQVVRESTLEPFMGVINPRRRLQDLATVAWNMSTASYFKAGGRPWKLARVREGVCYVGLTFKTTDRASGRDNACCAAQMFLDSGDGMVFKGAVGPWYAPDKRTFHLSGVQASSMLNMVMESYKTLKGRMPKEVFLHGRTRFNDEEWAGFSSSVPSTTSITGVRIQRSNDIKLFRPGRFPVLRGTLLKNSESRARLWTSGYIPKLQTYPGWEVPSPLNIEITRGTNDLHTVVNDVFGLTKLNFNACIYGDGLPVTLRFADLIGDILTAGPDIPDTPLPFRHYI